MTSSGYSEQSKDLLCAIVSLLKLSPKDRQTAFEEATEPSQWMGSASWLGEVTNSSEDWQSLLGYGDRPYLPGDHGELRRGPDGVKFICHPYHLNLAQVCEIVQHCVQYGLDLDISGQSAYNPGMTAQMVYSKKGEANKR